jgi:hypothetical protein
MKPQKTKRNRTGRKSPSEAEVQFMLATLASFGARAELVPTDGDPPESWEAWLAAREEKVGVPQWLLDYAATVLRSVLDCMPPDRRPPGRKPDPDAAAAMWWHELIGHPKSVAARLVANTEAWRLEREAADRRAKEQAEARRKEREQPAVQENIPGGIKGELEVWRVQNDERSFQTEEHEKAYTQFGKPESLAAVEDRARVLMRKMHPSRRGRRPTKLKN